MAKQEQIVVGIFANREQTREALIGLKRANFADEQIGFVLRDEHKQHTGHIQTENRPHAVLRGLVGGIMGIADALLMPITGPTDAVNILASTLPMAEEAIDHLPQSHKEKGRASDRNELKEGEQAGEEEEERKSILTGEIVGGVVGAAIGVLIPGIGPAIVVGSLASLFGVAFGGVASSFLGTFIHLGIPEEKARAYEQAVKTGQIVVTIKAAERASEAEEILLRHGAQHVERH